jgi:hypothetical protein
MKMKTKLNPVCIEMLMRAFYVRGPGPGLNSAENDALLHLRKLGLVEKENEKGPTGSYPVTTDKGYYHVTALCNMPLPKSIWITPKEEEIEAENEI